MRVGSSSPPDSPAERRPGPGRTLGSVHRSMTAAVGHVRDAPALHTAQRRFRKSAAQDMLDRLKEMQFVTTMTVFGATFLLSALPFMILVDSFAHRSAEDDLASHLGLNARAERILDGLFHSGSVRSAAAIAFAVLFTAVGTVGIAAIVETVYRQVFRTTATGRHFGRQLLWIGGLCAWLLVDSVSSSATHGLPAGVVLDGAATLLASTAFFWWSMHLLLAGQVRWRRLLLPAVLSAVLWLGLEVVSAFYFSSTIANDSRLYGTVGVVFSLLTWFMAIAAVVVLGALIGHTWQERHESSRRAEVARPPTDQGSQSPSSRPPDRRG